MVAAIMAKDQNYGFIDNGKEILGSYYDQIIKENTLSQIEKVSLFILSFKQKLNLTDQKSLEELLKFFKLDFEKTYDRVNWGFLLEVLKQRGFGDKFISWIHNLLTSGKSCVNINGELGDYFQCKRGLQQGDPLSPFLFNLVADVLNKTLKKTQATGRIRGLGNILNLGDVLNLHFADDTLIF